MGVFFPPFFFLSVHCSGSTKKIKNKKGKERNIMSSCVSDLTVLMEPPGSTESSNFNSSGSWYQYLWWNKLFTKDLNSGEDASSRLSGLFSLPFGVTSCSAGSFWFLCYLRLGVTVACNLQLWPSATWHHLNPEHSTATLLPSLQPRYFFSAELSHFFFLFPQLQYLSFSPHK